jgi:aminopeptidase N
VEEDVVPSLLREFSAPVKLNCGYSEDNLLHLMANDSDEFNRYQATQELFLSHLLKMVKAKSVDVDERLTAAFTTVLNGAKATPAVTALTLSLPSEAKIAQEMECVDVDAIYAARKAMCEKFAKINRKALESTYKFCQGTDPKSISPDNVGKRSLMNLCLAYLASDDDKFAENLAKAQFDGARNMTEERAALHVLINSSSPHKDSAISSHYTKWENEDLVINAWFGLLSGVNKPGNLKSVKKLLDHPAFNFNNPNRLRALVGGFTGSKINFHAADGSGYEFLADIILKIDGINSQTAARLSSGFSTWKKYPAQRQALMKKQLERIVQTKGLSKGTYEMISRSLG